MNRNLTKGSIRPCLLRLQFGARRFLTWISLAEETTGSFFPVACQDKNAACFMEQSIMNKTEAIHNFLKQSFLWFLIQNDF